MRSAPFSYSVFTCLSYWRAEAPFPFLATMRFGKVYSSSEENACSKLATSSMNSSLQRPADLTMGT